VKLARSKCDDVQFSAEDAGRTEPEFLCQVVETAIKSGASTINIPTPSATPRRKFRGDHRQPDEHVPNVDKAIIAVHCHNDLGLATANSITRGQTRGAPGGMHHQRHRRARRQRGPGRGRDDHEGAQGLPECDLQRGPPPRSCAPVAWYAICAACQSNPTRRWWASNAFAHSSGIHQDGVLKAKQTYEIMTPQSIGLKENKMNLTSRSGSHMVRNRLESLGYAEKDIDLEIFYPALQGPGRQEGHHLRR